jgi:hypothetical protein
MCARRSAVDSDPSDSGGANDASGTTRKFRQARPQALSRDVPLTCVNAPGRCSARNRFVNTSAQLGPSVARRRVGLK